MADIATIWDPATGRGDWAINGPDLAIDTTLQTAVLICLFTDAQAGPDDEIPDAVPGQPPNRRGWWADPTMGSKLWLRRRSKLTPALAAVVKSDIEACLQPLINAGVVASVAVTTQIILPKTLIASFDLFKADGTTESYAFDLLWKGLGDPIPRTNSGPL